VTTADDEWGLLYVFVRFFFRICIRLLIFLEIGYVSGTRDDASMTNGCHHQQTDDGHEKGQKDVPPTTTTTTLNDPSWSLQRCTMRNTHKNGPRDVDNVS
jgi:hypothetical protein